MNEAVSLRDLYERYSDHVQFLVIYIREAHPDDGWQMEPTGYNDPQTIEERRELAGTCEATMEYGIRTYVDEIHDPVMTAYVAWPERLYLIRYRRKSDVRRRPRAFRVQSIGAQGGPGRYATAIVAGRR